MPPLCENEQEEARGCEEEASTQAYKTAEGGKANDVLADIDLVIDLEDIGSLNMK